MLRCERSEPRSTTCCVPLHVRKIWGQSGFLRSEAVSALPSTSTRIVSAKRAMT